MVPFLERLGLGFLLFYFSIPFFPLNILLLEALQVWNIVTQRQNDLRQMKGVTPMISSSCGLGRVRH